jgi:hypothetical protein
MHRVATLGVPPPRDPRDRVQSGWFRRALLLRWLGVSVVLWALIASVTGLPAWWLILGAVATGVLGARAATLRRHSCAPTSRDQRMTMVFRAVEVRLRAVPQPGPKPPSARIFARNLPALE